MPTGLTLLLLVSLVTAASPAATAQSETPEASEPPQLPERVLFIGNSHTQRNGGVHWHVARMAESRDPPLPLQTDAETISGGTLQEHYEHDSLARLPDGGYDVVVLQGHIPRDADPTAESFLEYARILDQEIRGYGARTVFYMSWPHEEWPEVKLRDIVRAHRRVSAELGADVAPVALAMQQVIDERPELEMISADHVHATWAGTYLAAAVIYATLFDESPEGIDYSFGVSSEDAAYLQSVAWQSVVAWRERLARAAERARVGS